MHPRLSTAFRKLGSNTGDIPKTLRYLFNVKQKSSWFSQQYTGTLIGWAMGIIALSVITVMYFKKAAETYGLHLLPLSLVALLAGLIFEYRRLSGKWSTVLSTTFWAWCISICIGGAKVSEGKLVVWPYLFLLVFIIIATIIHYSKATRLMTEGVALLLTFAVNYWIIANDYWHKGSNIIKCMIAANVIISVFSLFNAFSYRRLSKASRLLFSIWCSIISLVLSIDNFLVLYRHRDIEHINSLAEQSLFFGSFFLLGVSSIYIAHNLTMIIGYLLSGGFFLSVKNMNDAHLKRFSDEHVYITDSIIVSIISLTGFTLNYFFDFVPVNFMIWSMVSVTPILLYIVNRIIG